MPLLYVYFVHGIIWLDICSLASFSTLFLILMHELILKCHWHISLKFDILKQNTKRQYFNTHAMPSIHMSSILYYHILVQTQVGCSILRRDFLVPMGFSPCSALWVVLCSNLNVKMSNINCLICFVLCYTQHSWSYLIIQSLFLSPRVIFLPAPPLGFGFRVSSKT